MSIKGWIRDRDVQYGEIIRTKVIDEDGSTSTLHVKKNAGETISPVRTKYVIRVKVKNLESEQEIYKRFSDELSMDDAMLDPSFRIERGPVGKRAGYYYVIKEFTQLEY